MAKSKLDSAALELEAHLGRAEETARIIVREVVYARKNKWRGMTTESIASNLLDQAENLKAHITYAKAVAPSVAHAEALAMGYRMDHSA